MTNCASLGTMEVECERGDGVMEEMVTLRMTNKEYGWLNKEYGWLTESIYGFLEHEGCHEDFINHFVDGCGSKGCKECIRQKLDMYIVKE